MQDEWEQYAAEPLKNKVAQSEWDQYADQNQSFIQPSPQFKERGSQGYGGILTDIAGIPSQIKQKAPEWWEQALSGLSGAKSQITSYPTRAATNIAGGALNIPGELFNLPFQLHHGAREYLKEKGLEDSLLAKLVPFDAPAEPIKYNAAAGLQKLAGMPEGEVSGDTTLQMAAQLPLLGFKTPKVIRELASQTNIGKLKSQLSEMSGRIETKDQALSRATESEGIASSEAVATQKASDEAIGDYLNKGAAHNVRAAKGLSNRVESIENYWKGSFGKLKSDLKDSNFQMENIPDYTDDMQYVITNIKDLKIVNGKYVLPGKPEATGELKSIIDKAPKSTDTSASDFITKYQDFRDARYDLLQRAKSASSASERKHMFEVYEETKPLEKSVKDALNEGLGEHKPEFERVNQGYSQQVYPLRNNAVVKKALKGKLGANIIEDVGGHGEGQELVRELIKQDPELLRNVLGQRYAAKPEKLNEISESSAEFLYEAPEISKMMNEFKVATDKKLQEVDAHKSQKNISLKQKIELEQEYKDLSKRLAQINSDNNKIMKALKLAGKTAFTVAVGAPIANKLYKSF